MVQRAEWHCEARELPTHVARGSSKVLLESQLVAVREVVKLRLPAWLIQPDCG